MQTEVTDYPLRDSIFKGNRLIKKVIAQQVAEVYPQTVGNDLTSQLFVYGREVNNFHTVDYKAISMLNVSATQE